MASTETAIHWYELRRTTAQFSIANRYGENSFDSSSAMYQALHAGELLPVSTEVGNTNSLFTDLIDNEWVETTTNARGNVVLLGKEGYADGIAGVAAIFIDNTRVIHCDSEAETIIIEEYSNLLNRLENPPEQIYSHPENDSSPATSLTNVGELEHFGIRDNTIEAIGWHFSSDMPLQIIEFIDAETNEVLVQVRSDIIEREDIKERYPDIEGVEHSGFNVSAEVPNGTSIYIRATRYSTTISTGDVIVFSNIIYYQQAEEVEEDLYPKFNNKFWYKLKRKGKTIAEGDKLLSDISFITQLMFVPSLTIRFPIEYAEIINGREEVLLYFNKKVFHGHIIGHEVNAVNGYVTCDIKHIVNEWTFRQIQTNYAIKARTVSDIYSTYDFRYVGWNMNYLQDSANEVIDYVYSRQNKLEGLTKTCRLTDNLFWRVSFDFGRKLDIGSFGERKPYRLSTHLPNNQNIMITGNVSLTHEYDHVYNTATVYGEKSDSGMSSMSLRDVYEDKGAWEEGFPIRILRTGINNERRYDYSQFSELAPNNDIEYSVIHEQSVEMESGEVIETTFASNDLSPFPNDNEIVNDEDRALASMMLYKSTIKQLQLAERRVIFNCDTTIIPDDINVGDMIDLQFDVIAHLPTDCTLKEIEVINENSWWYITEIGRKLNTNNIETGTLRLEKHLYTDREGGVS